MSPVGSIRKVAADHTAYWLIWLLSKICCFDNFFDNEECMRRTNSKLLVIHGRNDTVVPFHNGKAVVDVNYIFN
jgi:hypothetical protein